MRCGRITPRRSPGPGGLPIALPHAPALADAYLDRIDALVVTGGAFDVDPALYGAGERHATVSLKQGRTVAELALVQGALARNLRCSASAAASSFWPSHSAAA